MQITTSLLILFFSAFIGGTAVFFVKKDSKRRLKLLLSFSGSFLFAITVLHLLPHVYASHNHFVGVFVLIGFAFQIFLEQFSGGVEHGHLHVHSHQKKGDIPYGIMISLCLHAFLEAMPIANSHEHNKLLWGIALHHIPAAFALASILREKQLAKRKIILLVVVFALMAPGGLLFSESLSNHSLGYISKYADYIMGIVIGIFLHISTTILFESSEDHHFNFYKTLAIIAGAGIALLGFFLE